MLLKFGPTAEAMHSREHKLRVVKREGPAINSRIVRVYLGNGIRIFVGECMQQFLRLAPQLSQIQALGSVRNRMLFLPGIATMSSFPICARCPLARAEKSSSIHS